MICRNCGGQIPDGTKVCGFCETRVGCDDRRNTGEATELEKKMAELLMGTSCGDATVSEKDPDVKEAHWWKEGEDCAGCGGGLTGPDKDLKYAFTIVGLIAGVIVFALAIKLLLGF